MAPLHITLLTLLLTSTLTTSLPLNSPRQLHGEGVAADALLTDTDNGVGYGTENAEDNAAALIASLRGQPAPAAGGPGTKRQLHGEGVAADALLTDTDNGVGYGTENAEDNLASLIASARGQQAPAAGGPGTRRRRGLRARQMDKIVNGLGSIGQASGTTAVTDPVQSGGDAIDGDLTDGAANLGTEAGAMEEKTLEDAGSSVPTHLMMKARQLDKIANGFGNVADAAGLQQVGNVVVPEADTVDGQTTDDAANIGTQVGGDEETVLEQAGSDVPSSLGN